MPPKRKKSDSAPQRRIENYVRQRLARKLGWPTPLKPQRISYKTGLMEFDCYGEHDGTVLLGEINAHHGPLKAAQKNKVIRDIFKMFAQKTEQDNRVGVGNVRMVIVFTNDEAANFLQGHSWIAEVARDFGIESIVVQLNPAQIKLLQKTQSDQDLRN
ncbi:MAG: hypothetical protein WBN75_12425 [Verrucomicrobiia bacterium]